MRAAAIAYLATGIVFLVLDGIWLSSTAGTLYRPALGSLMLDRPVIWAAVLFYLLYLVGVVGLVVMPSLADGGWSGGLLRGALFGLVAYATYDLTNLATLRGWPLHITVLDLLWGTFATAASAAAGTWITAAILRR